MLKTPQTRTFRVGHIACGIGGGARGFQRANPRVGNLHGRFETAGGIDNDAGALANFEHLTGAKGTLLDLFSREQFQAFHGHEPPHGWTEAGPADFRRAFGAGLDVAFCSMPCKGFSGLMSDAKSKTDKYQALNGLTLRGIWLLLEAYKDDPVSIILFENVPRIANRGRWLLDKISELMRGYGYNLAEDVHDCGELGGLAQSRKRFLLIARHPVKVPPFVYQPPKRRLRGVGEVIGKLPLPGDPVAGVWHRVPSLQWQTWVRLAFVEAGKDWRSLNNLQVEGGVLKEFGIVPELGTPQPVALVAPPLMHGHSLGVCGWSERAPTVTSARAPGQGRYSVADPRYAARDRASTLGVTGWDQQSGVVAGESYPTNGRFSVADPRPAGANWQADVLGVREWSETSGTVAGRSSVTNGAYSIADPRPGYGPDTHRNVLGVKGWSSIAATITKGDMSVGGGPFAVADVRIGGRPRFNNTFRIVRFADTAPAVAGPGGPAGGLAVADPRPAPSDYSSRKYRVTRYGEASRTVIGASTTGDGAFAVADPRGGPDPAGLHGKYRVEVWIGPSRAVIGGRDNGAFAVADPRCTWGAASHQNKLRVTGYGSPAGAVIGTDRVGSGAAIVADVRREHYQTGGHYGVVPWSGPAGTVAGSACHDNGFNSVADPRDVDLEDRPVTLPAAKDKLVCRIVALDGTWHRPFTTLELGALQSLVDPEEAFAFDERAGSWVALYDSLLISGSDARSREWIGNMVPPDAATAMAETIGETLLLAGLGESFTLSTHQIWVKPLALALAVDGNQVAFDMERGAA